tara:strand:+ start:96 stop:299 length:204 start_codon:yes stop_codon:yes gene_type:complete
MKKAPKTPKKKSLIKAGVRIDPQFRGKFKDLVDSMTEAYKEYGFTRGQAAREIVKELRLDTIIKQER